MLGAGIMFTVSTGEVVRQATFFKPEADPRSIIAQEIAGSKSKIEMVDLSLQQQQFGGANAAGAV